MKNLPPHKIQQIKEFTSPIHQFAKIEEFVFDRFLAATFFETNTLFVNPEKWTTHFNNNDSQTLSAAERAILLHEIGHQKLKHVLPDVPYLERTQEYKDLIFKLSWQHEIEANKWALNYALENNWIDIFEALANFILLFKDQSKRDGKRNEIYYVIVDEMENYIKQCIMPKTKESA